MQGINQKEVFFWLWAQPHALEGILALLADWFISIGLMTRIMPRQAENERLSFNKKYINRYGEGYILHEYFAKYL